VQTRKVSGFKIAVLCLNTAWASQDNDDHRNLLLSERQAHMALKKANEFKPHLKIALMHHPLADMAEFDEGQCRAILNGPEGCHFLLRGHLHQTQLNKTINPENGWLELAAGACWERADHKRQPHAFNAVTLDLATRVGTVHVWSYSDRGFWAPYNHLYRGMTDGRWGFQLATPAKTEDPPPVPPFDGPLIPKRYRTWLEKEFGALESLNMGSDQPATFRLREVYEALATDWLEPEIREGDKSGGNTRDPEAIAETRSARRPLADLLALPAHRAFVVKGGPGSGKTTFLRRTALAELDRRSRLPLVLPLQKFGAWLDERKGEDGALLARWAGECLGKCGLDETTLAQRRGRGLLWLLDGLDEIFDAKLRLRAAKAIGEWAHALEAADRLLVTARPHALDQQGVRKALAMGEREAAVARLDREAQARFLDKWFLALYGPKAAARAAEAKAGLWDAMDRHDRVDQMRDTPLLLSMLAAVYASGMKLPDRRAALYEIAVWNLLLRRYGSAAGGSKAEAREMRHGLMAVARGMTERGHVREIGAKEFVDLLAQGVDGGRDRLALEGLAEDLGGRSGLLSMKGAPTRYAFSHLGFQEFLAARAYGEDEARMDVLATKLDDGAWKEIILLTAGYLCEAGPGYIGAGFVRALQGHYEKNPIKVGRLALTMEAAAEAPPAVLPPALVDELKTRAIARFEMEEDGKLEKPRAALGLALSRLGDPRLDMAKPVRWVHFGMGAFTMGSDKMGDDDNRPAHQVKLTKGFWLGRYPVTNQEYGAFVKAGGYRHREWWGSEAWQWLNAEGEAFDEWFENQDEFTKGYSKESVRPGRQPRYWRNPQWNGANQPVVGVNWHEAAAYCQWLTAKLKEENPDWRPQKAVVRLPTEAEWEYAARGGTTRSYPWGDEEPNEQRANFGHRIGQTSAVGIYPAGATPEGLWGMAGNVWECCADP